MNYYIRVFGWLFVGMGLVLGGLAALSILGAFPLTIEIFDYVVEGSRERLMFAASCGAMALVGLGLVGLARRRATQGSQAQPPAEAI